MSRAHRTCTAQKKPREAAAATAGPRPGPLSTRLGAEDCLLDSSMLSTQDSFDGRARDHTWGRQECYTVSAHENCPSDRQAVGDLDPNLLVPWIEPTAHRGNRLDNAPFIGCLPLCLTSPLPFKRFWAHIPNILSALQFSGLDSERTQTKTEQKSRTADSKPQPSMHRFSIMKPVFSSPLPSARV